jgi:sulfonate transport system permease protein
MNVTAARGRRRFRIRPLSILTLLVLVVGWEVASYLVRGTAKFGEGILPGWEVIFGSSFVSLADYWPGGLGVAAIHDGGAYTLQGAFLAVAYHSAFTLSRVIVGLLIGGFVGVGLGLAVGWSSIVRRLVLPTANFVRMMPLLALIPLFFLWFGDGLGPFIFVAFAVSVVFFVTTVTAIGNVPRRFLEYARTLGASPSRTYRSVVVPAIFPELRSGIMIALGLAWTAVLGAEYIGPQNGLGRILVFAEYFTDTGRMVLVTLFFVVYAALTYFLFNRIANRLTRWMP